MTLINQDCLDAMLGMPSDSIDLIYLDPPFYTQQKQSLSGKDGVVHSFNDVWDSMDSYLTFMETRLEQCHRLLKESGSIFLHCDTTAVHHLRLILDKIFGVENFCSEIIWTYRRWSNAKRGLLNAHQTILFYSKTNKYKFNHIYTNYSPTTNLDQILQDRIRNDSGKVVYKRDSDGDCISTTEKKGVPLSDVWEIPFLNPKAKERIGYPTQKPILLLERILEIASDEEDVVLDPFCGSGTTLVAAKLMNRKYIGIDINPDAIQITQNRLDNPIKSSSKLLEKGKEIYCTKTELETSILQQLDCETVQRNRGIDGIVKKRFHQKLVAVKIQKETETLSEAANLLLKAGLSKNCGYFVLIRTTLNQSLLEYPIPHNIIVLDAYPLALQKELEKDSEESRLSA